MTLFLLFSLLSQIAACGTLAATGAGRDSGNYGFNDNRDGHSDTRISAVIRSRLINEPDINANQIYVSTKQGIVTLHGRVADKSTRQRIITLCNNTPGVKQVNARLTVSQD
ncbi:MAG: BON domain-containing protein [Thiohalophilus sp.]|uniref:BON domain-containing protein n=1 Tax=Thiohalophilus sp. TaxID=3028392 RepID=UPI002870008E|nr:BON domain-containing protein [Thiohalophilus sp.]MDR9436751.1 BON domain-containing protein [Thiohalophilus sp.]